MTSEPDSTSRRRPPTIDLTATEVKAEKSAPETGESGAAGSDNAQAEPHQRAGGNVAGRFGWHVVSALVGAVVVAAIGAGIWYAGILPPQTVAPPSSAPSSSASPSAPSPSNDAVSALSAQLDKIQAELQPQAGDTALAKRIADLEAQTKTFSDSLAAINRRLDEIAVAAQTAREHADAATTAAQSATASASAATAAANGATENANAAAQAVKGVTQSSVQQSDLDALAARIAALENSIKSLSTVTTNVATSADDRAARAAVAAEALRAVVERGAPYQAELAAVKSFGADPSAIAALEPFAATGVPTDAELAHDLAQLLPSLRPQSAAAPSSSGFLGRLEDNAKNLVRITPINAPPGDDPSSVLARLNADAAHADIAAALTDIAALPPAEKSRAEAWVQQANARNAAIAASRRITADALAALSTVKSQ
jgi:hypothetical protein